MALLAQGACPSCGAPVAYGIGASVAQGCRYCKAGGGRGAGGRVAQGACPSGGAPVAYGIGASVAQVCRYCKAVVVRSDRDLRALGRVADLAPPTPLVGPHATGQTPGG